MLLKRSDFAKFFAVMHGGHPPFAWQERLLDHLLDRGRWPDRIVAPTGAGKTAVIDVHIFAQALTARAGDNVGRLPRRLAMVVGRRVLVDDQHEYALRLAGRLSKPDSPVLCAVAEGLHALGRQAALADGGAEGEVPPVAGGPGLVVARIRGGSPPSRAWRDEPSAAAVICATPDMWGSRVLFRGYGSAPLAWPREAGLLALDAVVVVDEAHLAQQLLVTARRVAQLTRVTELPLEGVPTLQVVETTATPGPARPRRDRQDAQHDVGVHDGDLADAPVLAQRLTRPKPVTLVEVPDWDGNRAPQRKTVAGTLADAVSGLVEDAHADRGGAPPLVTSRTVGCYVNTVARAVEVAAELRVRTRAGAQLRVVMVCGQTRPHDLDRLRAAHPGLLSIEGTSEVDVLVSTQSLEVGVDVDLAGVVTELASGPALVQRAGRVNRRGLRPVGPVVVVVPQGGVTQTMASGPYRSTELDQALEWVHECAKQPEGMTPFALRRQPPPAMPGRRVLYQRPELADVWHWARTSEDLAADPELDLWLAEDFDGDTSIGLVVREALPTDEVDAMRLVADLPARRHEVFPVPYRNARAVLRPPEAGQPAMIRVRGDIVDVLTWTEGADVETRPRIRPGDLVVVDSRTELFTPSESGAVGGFSPPVAHPHDRDGARVAAYAADDVLMAEADLDAAAWAAREVGRVVLRLERGVGGVDERAWHDLAGGLDGGQGEALTLAGQRVAVRAFLDEVGNRRGPLRAQVMASSAAALLKGPGTRSEVILHRDVDGELVRVLVLDRRRAGDDETLRQVWTPAAGLVTLTAHQQAVAGRAATIARALGLPPPVVEALRLAGAHHDDGKRDPRFQVRLGRLPEHDVLAKSQPGTPVAVARSNERRSGLPSRWRHEQRSVVECWHAVHGEPGMDPALAARLVGTSHGHGRATFPHAASDLLLAGDDDALRSAAVDLFDLGGWDELIEDTQTRYGPWGCAYLEAVLRAADGQVSQEGS